VIDRSFFPDLRVGGNKEPAKGDLFRPFARTTELAANLVAAARS
jgi:hypothetical protein